MGKFSNIAWTDHTFNGWIGCTKVSPGCKFCYAEHDTFIRRERSKGRELWGPTAERHHTSESYWNEPIKWSYEYWSQCQDCGWRGRLRLEKGISCPNCKGLNLQATRQRVFCMSLADVLEDRPDLVPWRTELFELIEQTPGLDWLLLSKRIELAPSLLPYTWFNGEWPANVWIGTSVEDQKHADARIPELLKCPAPVRFLSVEPQLEAIDFEDLPVPAFSYSVDDHSYEGDGDAPVVKVPGIDWVIVGGESGPKCRSFDWEWARQIRNQCQDAHVAFFMKQGGGYPYKLDALEDLPADLRIREWPK